MLEIAFPLSMRHFSLHFVLLISLGWVASCSSSTQTAQYRDAGPWAAGVTTLSLGDRSVEVWYPADPASVEGREPYSYFIRDALPEALDLILPAEINPPFVTDAYRDVSASTDGPFPLVIFAHGFASYRNQSTFLTTHLASWGFVVMSVDYLERGLGSVLGEQPENSIDDDALTRMVVALGAAENDAEGGLLEGRISTERIAITGHSAGGGTSIRFGGEPDVVTYIPLSAGISADSMITLPDKPSLWLTGDIDAVAELEGVERAFGEASPPARLVVIDDVGHLGPSDICAIGESGGGVVQIALDAGLSVPDNLVRLGTDGCQADALPPEEGWPPVRHFVTAQLRWAFGIDPGPVGLSQAVAADIPEAPFTYQEALK